jgi:hypothetical protein
VVEGGFAPGDPVTPWNLKDRLAALGSNRIGLDLRWSRLAPRSCWPGLPPEFETNFVKALGARYLWQGLSVLGPCLLMAQTGSGRTTVETTRLTRLRHGDLRRRASDHAATVLPAEHISREPGTIPTGSAAEPVSPFQPCGISRRAAGLRHGGVHAPHRVLPVASSCECTGIISCSLSLPGNMTKAASGL